MKVKAERLLLYLLYLKVEAGITFMSSSPGRRHRGQSSIGRRFDVHVPPPSLPEVDQGGHTHGNHMEAT